jgi:hypothetical protein
MIRLRLTLPPLTPREALTLSYLCDLFDTVLWAQYGEAMTVLLQEEPFVPDPGWSIDPVQGRKPRRPPARGSAPGDLLSDGAEVERGDVKKRGR